MYGFTGVLSFQLDGGVEKAERFISALRLASHGASLGGVETLIVRPAAMLSHQIPEDEFRRTGVTPELMRVSVGIEDERDLIADIERALDSV
jgi:cystathionine gamma-lyase